MACKNPYLVEKFNVWPKDGNPVLTMFVGAETPAAAAARTHLLFTADGPNNEDLNLDMAHRPRAP